MAEELVVRGLTDEQLADYEAQIEAAMLKALERVMDQIADRIGRHSTEPSGPKAAP